MDTKDFRYALRFDYHSSSFFFLGGVGLLSEFLFCDIVFCVYKQQLECLQLLPDNASKLVEIEEKVKNLLSIALNSRSLHNDAERKFTLLFINSCIL